MCKSRIAGKTVEDYFSYLKFSNMIYCGMSLRGQAFMQQVLKHKFIPPYGIAGLPWWLRG